ncbi:MAG: DNA alkylation repair protein [Flavipsychrobacter sp.]|nr:DNA alkylation repair protein [Flavipsychrobacter sp.]
MTLNEIMTELSSFGNENIKKILLKHGVKEPLFGVKVEHLKTIQKKVKKDYTLANELYFTRNADAMYLAGLIADDEKMSRDDLQAWVEIATSTNISEYTVPWVAAGSKHGLELGQEWINAEEEHIAAAGWATLSGLVAIKADEELDLALLRDLLQRIEKNINTAPNQVRHAMNGFVIAIGVYVKELTQEVIDTALKISATSVQPNGTASKLPDAIVYIKKAIDKGQIGKKKKTLKC